MSQKWTVMYTKDKMKKSRVFHDGFVTVSAAGKAMLYSEDGEMLDSGNFAVSLFVPDAQIDFDRFLVEVCATESPVAVAAAAPRLPPPPQQQKVSFQENRVPRRPPFLPPLPERPAVATAGVVTSSAMPVMGVVVGRPAGPAVASGPKRSLSDVLSMMKQTAAATAATTATSFGVGAVSDMSPPRLSSRPVLPHLSVSDPPLPPNAFASIVEPVHAVGVSAAEPPLKKHAFGVASATNRPKSTFLSGPIRFPSRDQVRDSSRTLTVVIPYRFATVKDYSTVYSNAVRETCLLQICRAAEALYGVLAKSPTGNGNEALFKVARIEAYANCQLATREWRGLKGKMNVSLVLTLPQSWQQRSRGEHAKDDLWVLSFSGAFDDAFIVRTVFHGIGQNGAVNLELMPHQTGPVVARGGSDSTQVNQSFKSQHNLCAFRLLSASTELQELAALAAFGEDDPMVNSIVVPQTPLKAPRFSPFPPTDVCLSPEQIAVIQSRIVREFALNAEQQIVLGRVASWFEDKGDAVTLVHGVFGAGKSTLLVAIILFLVEVMDKADQNNDDKFVPTGRKERKADEDREEVGDDDDDGDEVELFDGGLGSGRTSSSGAIAGIVDPSLVEGKPERRIRMRPPPFRVAISSATNTAVDRVLEGLLEAGCRDFLRVGSLKKMSRRVLPFTLYEEEKDAIHELRKQLRDDELSAGERLDLERELEELVSGRAGKRKERLGLCPIVGTTCSASLFKLFKDHQFSVLMLDECSQMVEPLSLLPIKSFLPRRMICVGDPMQLALHCRLRVLTRAICRWPCFRVSLSITSPFCWPRSTAVILALPIWRRDCFMAASSSRESLLNSACRFCWALSRCSLWTRRALGWSRATAMAVGATPCTLASPCS